VVLQVVEVGDGAGTQPGAFTLKVVDLYVPATDVVEQDVDLAEQDGEDEVRCDGTFDDEDTLNPDEDHKGGGSSGCNTTANGNGSMAALLLGLAAFLLWRRRLRV
jgi:MYXO-CTERM domain-containing protein